jgi:hypothetical protein
VSFITGTQAELLYTLPATLTKNTYTTEAAFTGVAGTNTIAAIPAGWLVNDNPNPVGRALHYKAAGTIGNTAAATFVINLGLDTTAGTKANATAVMTATAPPVAAGAPWFLDAFFTCTAFATTTYTLQLTGNFRMESSNGGAAGSGPLCTGFSASVTGLVPSTQYFIELFGTWSASSASNTTTLQQVFLWGLN